jgi:hypothetical protein
MENETRVDRSLSVRPTDEDSARAAVALYRSLTVAERFEALVALLRDMDVLLVGRTPRRSPDDEDFWLHWKDPSRGRPR